MCNVSSLLPLLCIGWLDGVGDVSEEDLEAAEQAKLSSSVGGDEAPNGTGTSHLLLKGGIPHEHSNEHGRIEER